MTETTTTPDRTVLTGKILSQAAFTATIDAPIGKIDIADWLRTLPDREYQRCAPPDHKATGYTTTDDGRPMSINAEMIGTGLVVQHYAYETAGKDHCIWCRSLTCSRPAGGPPSRSSGISKADPIDDKTSSTPTRSPPTRPRSSWTSSPGTARPSRRPPPPGRPHPVITAAARRRYSPPASVGTPTRPSSLHSIDSWSRYVFA
jgi:hypothetical protein